MTKQHLLLVDGDPRTLHVLGASLRTAGFAVTTAGNGSAALARCRVSPPDLVVSDTTIPGMDGFQLCQAIKADEALRDTPVVFLSGQGTVEEKVRGFEVGIEDFLTKPIDTREFVARVRMLVEKRRRERLGRSDQPGTFSGSLRDLSVADLLQTLEIGRKTGIVRIEAPEERTATLWLKDGCVIDAIAGRRSGESAVHWLLRWRDGRFAIEFGPVDHPARIDSPTQHLLLEGMRRLDEWARAVEQLPPLDSVLQIDFLLLSERLADIPDEVNAILKIVDGRRTIGQLFEDTELDELSAAAAVEGLLRDEIVRVRSTLVDVPPALPRAVAPAGSRVPPLLPVSRKPVHGGAPAQGQGPSLATAIAAAARPPTLERVRPPRIVRFGPKMALVTTPVSAARLPRRAEPVATPAARPPPLVPVAMPEPAVSPGGPGGTSRVLERILAALVLVAVAAGVWWMLRPDAAQRTGVVQRAGVVQSAGASAPDAYQGALAEAQRDHSATRYPEAVASYRRAIAARETPEAYEGLGRALRDAGDLPAAVDALRHAIDLDPGDAAAYIALARMYGEERRVEEARAAYQRYLALAPGGAHADEARAAVAAQR